MIGLVLWGRVQRTKEFNGQGGRKFRSILLSVLLSGVLSLALLTLLLLPAPPAQAQGGYSPWRTFTATDGLAGNDVRAILQAKDGALWLGTRWGGVSHYDGATWRTFTTSDGLAHSAVWAILQAEDGALWFGTQNGVSRYAQLSASTGDEGEWQTFTTADGLANNDVQTILQANDGSFWFGTQGGVSHYIPLEAGNGEWQTITTTDGLAGNEVQAILQAEDGALWFGTRSGVSRYDGKAWQTFTTTDGLVSNEIQAILQTTDGSFWFGTNNGVSHYIPPPMDTDNKGTWQTFTTADGLARDDVRDMLQAEDGTLWFATMYGGVSHYIPPMVNGDSRGTWQTFTVADGLPHYVVWAILQSEDGALWVGTEGGLCRYDPERWQTFTITDGLADNDVHVVVQAKDGALWFGTLGGVSRYVPSSAEVGDTGAWQTFTTVDGLVDNDVRVIVQAHDGALWFGTSNGVSRYVPSVAGAGDGGRWQTFTTADGLVDNGIRAIWQAHDDALWFGTLGGVSRYIPPAADAGGVGTWQTFTAEDGLANDDALAILQARDGTLWFGTAEGVSRYSPPVAGTDSQGIWQTITTADGLAHNHVQAVLQARDGTFWFGTWAGVSHYAPPPVGIDDKGNWETYTTADGLGDHDVRSILQAEDGTLWFSTYGGGVSHYDGVMWQTLTVEHGLAGNIVMAILQTDDGILWFGTWGGGISRYQPEGVPPWIRIIELNNRPLTGEAISLPYADNDLTVSFIAGDLSTPPEDLIYLYKLEGIDDDWVVTSEKVARYRDLPSASYIFGVKARDEAGNYSEPATATFTVQKPPLVIWTPLNVLGSVAIAFSLLVTVAFIIRLYKDTRRARQAIERKFNPYISGDPVRESNMFFGREELLKRITNTLHNNSIMIHGPRRIGKTSLLYQLADRLRATSDPDYVFIPALIDLEGTVQEEFFHTLMEEILEDCQPYLAERLPLAYNEKGKEAYTHRDFARDLRTLIDHLQQNSDKEVRLILLLDEVDVMNRYDQLVQQQLRRIFMKTFARNLGAVVAGVHISKEWDRLESPWYNLFLEMELLPLSREEAVRLIKEPVKGVYSYEEEAIEAIWEHSQGHPQLVQQLCLEAVNRLLQEKRSRLTKADVESVYREIVAWEKAQEEQKEHERVHFPVKRVAEEGSTYEAEEGTDVWRGER